MDFISGDGGNGLGSSRIDRSDTIVLSFDVQIKSGIGFISPLATSADVISFAHLGISGLLFDLDT